MTRLRHKGKASQATLYDLENGYITIAGTIKPRPGTFLEHTLPIGTKGFAVHKSKFNVFSSQPVTMTDGRFVNNILRHPTSPTAEIAQIHFQSEFMGFLYVVAEFDDGQIFHYYLEALATWGANTGYKPGDRVFPSVANGYAYRAKRLNPPELLWAVGVERAIGDVVEPTVGNGFKYTVIAVSGANPASGQVQPAWPAADGATIVEHTDTEGPVPVEVVTDPVDPYELPPRYENPNFPGPYETP
jgi:hypothetical protein